MDSGESIEKAFLELRETTDGIVASIVYDTCDILMKDSSDDELVRAAEDLKKHFKSQ